MPAPAPQLQERSRIRGEQKPRLALALSGGIHGLALIAFLLYHAFPPTQPSVVPIFEMVSLEPPKLRPLRPKTPEPPPPEPEEVRTPEAPKLSSKPDKAVVPKKPEPKTLREPDSTLPVKDVPEQTQEMTTTIVSNVPADPRLSIWATNVKRKVERQWNPPSGIDVQGGTKTVIAFEVSREGEVSGVEISGASGNAMLDELAQRTIMRVERVPPIPENYPEDVIKVSYEFIYSGQ